MPAIETGQTTPRGDLGRVVVIGGNGFLGHHIVAQALSSSWTASAVSSIDLRCDRNRDPRAAYYECDITDAARLTAVLDDLRPDVVVHTASPVGDDYKPNKDLYRSVNVDGTAAVIAACRKTGVKALVYTSSASVISDNKTDLINADERWPVLRGGSQPDYYSETKAHAEQLVLEANRKDGNLLTTAVRPAGIFGEGDVQALAGFLKAYRDGRTNVQLGDNTNIFDFTYVGNVSHAHLLAAHLLLATSKASTAPLDHEKVDGEAFLVTNDSPAYFWDFARALWRAAGKTTGNEGVWTISRENGYVLAGLSEMYAGIRRQQPTFSKKRVTFATMTRYYNISKAKRVLRYQPIWTLQQGVDRGVAWFLDEEKKNTGKAQ